MASRQMPDDGNNALWVPAAIVVVALAAALWVSTLESFVGKLIAGAFAVLLLFGLFMLVPDLRALMRNRRRRR